MPMNATVQKVVDISDRKENGSIIVACTAVGLVLMINVVMMAYPEHLPVALVQRSKVKVNKPKTICQTTTATMQVK